MKKKLYRKSGNKKLELNKQKISELSEGNLFGIKGGSSLFERCYAVTEQPGCENDPVIFSEVVTICFGGTTGNIISLGC